MESQYRLTSSDQRFLKECGEPKSNPNAIEIRNAFNTEITDVISTRQREVVSKYWGMGEEKSRDELENIVDSINDLYTKHPAKRSIFIPSSNKLEAADWRHLAAKIKPLLNSSQRRVPGKLTVSGRELHYVDLHSVYHQVVQIFGSNLYGFKSTASELLILDCGAHIGLSTIYFAQRYPKAEIHAFEADPKIVEMLKHNTKAFGIENINIHCAAVWSHNNGVLFNSTEDDSGYISSNGTVRTPSIRLKDLLENQVVDLLKMDIEGAEFEVIKDCDDLLKNVRSLIVEVHHFRKNEGSLAELLTILENNGFSYLFQDLHFAVWLKDSEKPPFDISPTDKYVVTLYAWQKQDDIKISFRTKERIKKRTLTEKPLRVVHLTVQDFGGAGKAAYRLHKGLQEFTESTMLVLNKSSQDPSVKIIKSDGNGNFRVSNKTGPFMSPLFQEQYLEWKTLLEKYPRRPNGLEMFTGTRSLVDLSKIQEIQQADIINFHWVAGLIDFSNLPAELACKPIVWTLHDMNPFTGGCHYSGDCLNYRVACKACPQLGSKNAEDDANKHWRCKIRAYRGLNLTIVTPSRWLAECARKSLLFSNRPVHRIPYGIPPDTFQPQPKPILKKSLGIPEELDIILFGADAIANQRKGFLYLLKALNELRENGRRNLALMTFGNMPKDCEIPIPYPLYHLGYIREENQLSMAYNVADVFVIPALEDNLPNTPIEAAACGIPAVGFRIGGIPDIIEHGKTGYLAEPENSSDLAKGIAWVLDQVGNSTQLSDACRKRAEIHYTLNTQAKAYIDLYRSLVPRRGSGTKTHNLPAPTHYRIENQSNNEPILTAIVSTYNSERFLAGCLENLLQQTIADQIEIIVVNSGSEENEESVAKRYQRRHSNIQYIKTECRENVYSAWNRAIKIASGKYITNANTDDRHRKDAYEVMVNVLEENPGISLVYADVLITERENETFEDCTPSGIYRWLDWNREALLFKGCFMGPQPMWRRDVHDEYGYFDENLVTSGDYEFWLRISQTRNFYHLPETLGLYLKSPYSIEHQNRTLQYLENRRILKIYQQAYYQNRIVNRINPRQSSVDSGKMRTPKTIDPFPEKVVVDSNELAANEKHLTENLSGRSDESSEGKTSDSLPAWELDRTLKFAELNAMDGVVVDFLQTADILFQKESLDEAVDVLLKAIGANPRDSRSYLALARHLINHGRYEPALEALAEIPADLGADVMSEKRLLEGYAEVGLGRMEAAELKISDFIEANPTDARLINLRGMLAFQRGDIDRAKKLFQQAIETDSQYGEAYTNLGIILGGTGEPKQAMKCHERAMSLSPLDIDVANAYHEAIASAGAFTAAEELAADLLKRYPNSRKLHYLLIDVLIQQGKMQAAQNAVENALALLGTGSGLLDTALAIREKINRTKRKGKSQKNGVSLCMIVKDEEGHLARCLNSVKPIVDETIVVDTGSKDRTRDVAAFFGAKVYDFEWNGDFAAARNFSLSKATCGWVLIMDADEVISARDYHKFRKLTRKRPQKPVAYSITTRNYCNLANTIGWEPNRDEYPDEEAGWGWLPSTKVRLFYGKKRIRFEGAVHEMVDFALKREGIPVKVCKIPVHHYGRLDTDRMDRKGEIYYEIGRRKLEESENDIAAVRELAVQTTILARNQEAVALWQRFLTMSPPPKAAAEAHINLATLYLRMKAYENAQNASEEALKVQPDMKEAHYNLALSRLHLGRAEAAYDTLNHLVNEHPDYPPAQFVRAAVCFILGDKERAMGLLEELRNGSFGRILAQSFGELTRDLEAAGHCHYARSLLEAALENGFLTPGMLSMLGIPQPKETSAVA
jgi:FkbM family methyltransferase